jgi:hypothetical protein
MGKVYFGNHRCRGACLAAGGAACQTWLLLC